MKKGIIISGISCLILLGTVGAITAGKILINNKQETVTETSAYQSKEINHALATGDEVVGSWDVSEKGDGSVTATLYGDGKMVISGTGNMKNYSSSSNRPYDGNKTDIKTVEIQSGVTSIGNYAFVNCSSLISIEIPSSVTSIGNCAFGNCSRLTSIKVEKDNKNYISENGILFNKDKTKIICYPAGKKDIVSYTIPVTVTSIGDDAFFGCSSLTSIEIPNSVISIEDMVFWGCSSLTSIEIPSSVTSIEEGAFAFCSSLTSINVEKDNKNYISENGILFNKGKTKIICYPAGKKDTISYTIPNTVTSIGSDVFFYCKVLARIIIPNSVTSIGSYAFDGCSSLTIYCEANSVAEQYAKDNKIKYTTESIDKDNINIIGTWNISATENDNVIATLYYDGKLIISGTGNMNNYSNYIAGSRSPYYNKKTSILSVDIQSGVTSIGNYAFYYCESLTSIEIPSSVTSIGGDTFRRCTSLTNINVEKNNEMYSSEDGILLNKDKTEIICYPEGKKDIISYTIPNTVTSIGSKAFYNCEVLSRIIIPNSVTSIGSSAFDGCSSLTIYCKSNTKAEEYARENSKNYIIDDVAPIVNITGNPTSWTKENVTLTVNASDNLSGLATKAYSFDNGTTWQAENTKTYTENTNGIVIKVKDNLDNIATVDIINITKIDKTAPTITSVTGNPTSWTKGNVTLTVNASDNLSGLATKAYSFDNGTTWQAENTKTYTENTNGIIIKVKDNLDNIATYQAINITKIIEPESISIKTKPNKTTYFEGETLNTSGLVLIKKYNDGSQEEVTSEYTCTPTTLNTAGIQKITVTFAGKKTTFEVNVLKVIDTSEYKVENNNIKGTQSKTTLENFKKKITINGANTKIVGKNNNELKNTDIVTTGTKIKTTVNNKEVTYAIIVTGDTNGDGQADLKDMLTINKHRLNKAQLTDEYLSAGDVNGDGKVDIKDLLQINKFRLGKINSL